MTGLFSRSKKGAHRMQLNAMHQALSKKGADPTSIPHAEEVLGYTIAPIYANGIAVAFERISVCPRTEEYFVGTLFPHVALPELGFPEEDEVYRRGAKVGCSGGLFGVVKGVGTNPYMLALETVRHSDGHFSAIAGGIYRLQHAHTDSMIRGNEWDGIRLKRSTLTFTRFFEPENISPEIGEFTLDDVLEQGRKELRNSQIRYKP